MSKIVNPKWKAEIESMALQGKLIDETVSPAVCKQWLVSFLSKLGIPYVVHNIGCGVARITTETQKCPCCGKNLNGGA